MGDLLKFDQHLFELINIHWSHPFFDAVLPMFREKLFWLPFYVFLLVYALVNLGRLRWLFVGLLILAVGLSDLTSSELIKKTVQRPRPCHEQTKIPDIHVLVPCGSGYSFTSSHASNHFAVAMFLMFSIFKRPRLLKWLLFLWAFTISYAQVYVGVHYPLDVLGGALVGISYGLLMAWVFDYLRMRIND